MIKVHLMICQINMNLITTSDDQETPDHAEILIKTGHFYSHHCLLFWWSRRNNDDVFSRNLDRSNPSERFNSLQWYTYPIGQK